MKFPDIFRTFSLTLRGTPTHVALSTSSIYSDPDRGGLVRTSNPRATIRRFSGCTAYTLYTAYMRLISTGVSRSVVCVSVCLSVSVLCIAYKTEP